MSLNLNVNQDSILTAWKDVVSDKTKTDWILLGYEGNSFNLKLVSKGDGGLEELKDEFVSSQVMYAFIKVEDSKTSLPKFVLINWQGEDTPLIRKGTCAKHLHDVERLLKVTHLTVNVRNEDEIDTEDIMIKVSKLSAGLGLKIKEIMASVNEKDNSSPVSTDYKKIQPKAEINAEERDKFWQKEEEEEKRRQNEEKQKREELKRKTELEIKLRETEESAKRTELNSDTIKRRVETNRDEAKAVISQRKIDARAVFEQNTAAGQLNKFNQTSVSPDLPTTNEIDKNAEPIKNFSQDVTEILSNDNVETQETITNYEGETYRNVHPEAKVDEQMMDYGLKAEALYDYQAADETEISFDPGDIILCIDQIDSGWWQGLSPNGTYGLFPANYVQLLP